MLATVLGIMVCASQVFAQSTRAMAVLNIEGDGVSRDTADTLSAVVRSEAQQIVKYQVVNSTPINLSEVVVLLGCNVTDIDCLNQASEQLDASVLVYGSITKEGSDYRLRLAIFDSESSTITHRMQEVIKGSGDLVFDAREEIEEFFQEIRLEQIAAKLTISSNVRGASIFLNGEPSGTTPLDDFAVPPGTYKIEVKKKGFTEWSAEMELGERASMKLRAPLKPLPATSLVTTPQTTEKTVVTSNPTRKTGAGGGIGEDLDVRKRRKGVNVGAVSLLAVGAVSMAASGVVAVQMNQLSDDLDARAKQGTLTPSERDDGIARGLNLQRTHRVLLGLGAASAVVGGVWLLTDVSKKKESGVASRELRLHLSPSQVGASVRW